MTERASANPRTKKPALIAVAALLLSAALAGGIFVWHRRSIVAANVPDRPALRGWPAEFGTRIDEAENDAASYLHCVRGLGTLSRLYHINGFYNQALSCYDGLRTVQPHVAKWWHLEANILADFGRSDDAIALYREAIRLDPSDDAGRVKLGEILLKSNRPKEAAAVFNDALQVNARNVYASLGMAQLASARGDWTSAEQILQGALRGQPDFVGALSLRITAEEKLGNAAAARSLHETLGSQEFVDIADPWAFDLYRDCYDAYRLSVAAVVQRFAKNYPEAIALFEQAIQLAPDSSAYQRELGLLLADLERYGEALPHAERATELAPNDPHTWALLVRVLTELNNNDGAWRALYEGLEHCPDSQDLHLTRGNRLLKNNRPAEAVTEFQETHRLWPSEATPLVDLAEAYFKLGENEKALASLEEALERQPGNPAALSVMTVYFIQTGDKAAAQRAYHQLEQHAGAVGPVLGRLQQNFQSKFGESLE